MQDWSIQHERSDEQVNPSEKIIMQQAEAASSMWANLETEESLVPSLGLPKPMSSSVPSNLATHGSTRNSKSGKLNAGQATGGRSSTPSSTAVVEAARQRTKTFKEYRSVESGMKRAMELADKILNETALKAHNGCQDRAGSKVIYAPYCTISLWLITYLVILHILYHIPLTTW